VSQQEYRCEGFWRQHIFMSWAKMGSQSLGILSRVLDVTDVMICTGSTPAHGRFLAIISLEINISRKTKKVRNVCRACRASCRVMSHQRSTPNEKASVASEYSRDFKASGAIHCADCQVPLAIHELQVQVVRAGLGRTARGPKFCFVVATWPSASWARASPKSETYTSAHSEFAAEHNGVSV
jgi:hypothetical protein